MYIYVILHSINTTAGLCYFAGLLSPFHFGIFHAERHSSSSLLISLRHQDALFITPFLFSFCITSLVLCDAVCACYWAYLSRSLCSLLPLLNISLPHFSKPFRRTRTVAVSLSSTCLPHTQTSSPLHSSSPFISPLSLSLIPHLSLNGGRRQWEGPPRQAR